jgi:hypothetical protein
MLAIKSVQKGLTCNKTWLSIFLKFNLKGWAYRKGNEKKRVREREREREQAKHFIDKHF